MKVDVPRGENGMGKLWRILDDMQKIVLEVGEGADMKLVCDGDELLFYRQEGSEDDSFEKEILCWFG